MPTVFASAQLFLLALGVGALILIAYRSGRIDVQMATTAKLIDGMLQRFVTHDDSDARQFAELRERTARVEERVGIVHAVVDAEISDLKRTR